MLLDIFVDEFSTLSNIYRSRKNYSLYLSKKLFSLLKQKTKINNEPNKTSLIKIRKDFLIKKIIELRKIYIIKIQSSIRMFLKYKRYKSFQMIKYILKERIKNAILIQSIFRMKICRKHINELLNNDALFFYKFPNDILDKIFLSSNINELKKKLENNELNISMIIQKPKMNLDFKFNKYLNSYYTAIKKIKLMRKIILCNFTVNNEKFIDPRYSITNDNEGNFYNILTSKMFYRKRKDKRFFLNKKKIENEKHWEELFELKSRRRLMSYDASSISSKTDISKELDKNLGENFSNQINVNNNNEENNKKNKPLQSILRRRNFKKDNLSLKRVSFDKKIEFCE